MTTIAILPENPGSAATSYLAIAGQVHCVGKTAGQALDALTSKLNGGESTLVIVQHLRPDRFFSEAQQERLEELMSRWRHAQETDSVLPSADQAELEALVEAELKAAGARAARLGALLRQGAGRLLHHAKQII